MKLAKIFSILLALSLLCSCGQPAATDVTTAPAQDIHLENGYVVVVDADAPDAAYQAAVCVQATLDEKVGLVKPQIVTKEPSSKAIVMQVDETLSAGQYEFKPTAQKLTIRAGSAHVLLYAAKQLHYALMQAENPKQITVDLCAQLSGTVDAENLPFTVMTQNILFKEIEGGNLVSDRAPRFQKLMEEYQPDILFVQECTGSWFTYFKKYFGDTYFAINSSSNTILLRSDRYELLEQGIKFLSATPDVPSQFDDASSRRNTAWAIIRDKMTDTELYLWCPHLDWNHDEARIKQTNALIGLMEPHFDQYPTLSAGDFNSTPDSPIYARMTEVMADSRASAELDLTEVDHTYHAFYEKSTSFIDYIFHTPQFDVSTYRVLSDNYNGYISDHYGLVAEMQLVK